MSERPGDTVSDDPAPYAWLDDDARMAGAISPGVTLAFGVVFLVAAVALVVVSVASSHLFGLWIAVGWAVLGALITRMGLARRAWRQRHPGVDPLSTVPSPTGGSAYGPDTRGAGVGRWVLLVLCTVLGLLFLLAFVRSFTVVGTDGALTTRITLAVLAAVVLAVAWFDLRAILRWRGREAPASRS